MIAPLGTGVAQTDEEFVGLQGGWTRLFERTLVCHKEAIEAFFSKLYKRGRWGQMVAVRFAWIVPNRPAVSIRARAEARALPDAVSGTSIGV